MTEGRQAGTWAPGTGLDRFEPTGWPDGRTRMAINVLVRLSENEIDANLPDDVRDWVNASAA